MKTKSKIILSFLLVFMLTVALYGPVSAQQQQLSITFAKTATLVDGGQAVELRVRTVCAIAGAEVLEAFVYVTQNGNQSQFAPIPVTCSDKHRPQKATVIVPSLDFLFQEGDANISTYILVVDPATGDTYSVSTGGVIRIR